ncbi:MAG: hypothetical protein CM1200mP10_29700 [Candidatus Neomarinimicrobiota bacterium]|nr:MAG: hypothetical protein CM1200mP10_29700 [Candidatus Neomarinimicrobiota bacterium]
MVKEMGWLKDLARADLTIIPLSNWQRTMWLDELENLYHQWFPDVQDVESLLAYMGMYLFKGTNLNIGHGKGNPPFFRIGAPWISGSICGKKFKIWICQESPFTKYVLNRKRFMMPNVDLIMRTNVQWSVNGSDKSQCL